MVKILYIDDNLSVKRIFELKYSSKHYVIFAEDGRDGLEKLLKESPDLVFVDYDMPNMNGLEFAREIRNYSPYKKYSKILIIGVGGFPHKGALAEETKAWLDEVYQKPIDYKEIDKWIIKAEQQKSEPIPQSA